MILGKGFSSVVDLCLTTIVRQFVLSSPSKSALRPDVQVVECHLDSAKNQHTDDFSIYSHAIYGHSRCVNVLQGFRMSHGLILGQREDDVIRGTERAFTHGAARNSRRKAEHKNRYERKYEEGRRRGSSCYLEGIFMLHTLISTHTH